MSIRRRTSRTAALLKYHRPNQFAWRLIRIGQRKLRPLLPNHWSFQSGDRSATWKDGAAEAFHAIADRRMQLWPSRHAKPAEISAGTFRFLNQSCNLRESENSNSQSIDWNPDLPRLWRFHLQCHEYLPECAREEGPNLAYGLLQSWLDAPRHQHPTSDPDAWHPFCISRRIPAWLTLAAVFPPPDSIRQSFWGSLADQIAWLAKNCEWDLGGNHLLENLSTLFLAECFLDLDPKLQFKAVGRSLAEEFEQQLLDSGEHMERTPTYHALMTVCVLQSLEAAKFCHDQNEHALAGSAEKMAAFLHEILSPNESIPLLGDSCMSETPDVSRLLKWADDIGLNATRQTVESDYWKSQSGEESQILFDMGQLACDHLPAHGHADLLNVTATISGIEAIVDTGVFQYESGPLRDQSRCTAAHNVLQVDDKEQCDLWSSFRMGRRGHVLWKNRGQADGMTWCAAAHDGYGIAVGRLVITSNESWAIIDWFDPESVVERAVSRLHWHSDWTLNLSDDERAVTASHSNSQVDVEMQCLGSHSVIELEDSRYWPDFGVEHSNQRLQVISNDLQSGWIGIQLNLQPQATLLARSIQSSNGLLQVDLQCGQSITLHVDHGPAR